MSNEAPRWIPHPLTLTYGEMTHRVISVPPRTREVLGLRAMGLSFAEISTSLKITTQTAKNEVWQATIRTPNLTSTHLIMELLKSGGIDREELSSSFDFSRFSRLTPGQIALAEFMENPDVFSDTEPALADKLDWTLNKFKVSLYSLQKALGVSNALRMRVFMFLLPEEYRTGAKVTEETS